MSEAADAGMRCEVSGCLRPAWVDARWGSDALPHQKATLCQCHMDELWKSLNPLLQTGRSWLSLGRPGEFKEAA